MLKLAEECMRLMSAWGCVALGIFIVALIIWWRGRGSTMRRAQWFLALLPAIVGGWGCYHEFTGYREIATLMQLGGSSAEQIAMVSQGGIAAAWKSLCVGLGTTAVLLFLSRRSIPPPV